MKQAGGGVERFRWTGSLAWKKDFIEAPVGYSDWWVDNADIVLYAGHGCPIAITFTGGPGPDPEWLFYDQANRSWGDLDQDWMCFLSCSVLRLDDPSGEAWRRWGPNFDGLHILTGFHSAARANTGFPRAFANNLLGAGRTPMSVMDAWFDAASARHTGIAAAMGPIGRGGAWNYGDYYWGKGPVGPRIRSSQILGWWYVNQDTDLRLDLGFPPIR